MASIQDNAMQGISNSMPVRNLQTQQGLNAANMMSVQSLGGQATKALTNPDQNAITNINTMAQQAGASTAQTAGKQQVAAAGQAVSNQGQLGSATLASQSAENQQALGLRKLKLDQMSSQNSARLSGLSQDLKNQLLDKQLAFQKDQMGRTVFNDRQLADWAVTKAKSQQDLANYTQSMTQAHSRMNQLVDASYAKIQQVLQQENQKSLQDINQAARLKVAQANANFKNWQQHKASADSQFSTMVSVIGVMAGVAATVAAA